MTTRNSLHRWTAALLVGAFGFLTIAPAAEASHGRGRRYKGSCETRVVRTYSGYPTYSRVVVRERSSAGPVIAGLIGGFLIGTAVASSSRPAHASVSYRYEDPYCGDSYDTVDEYWHEQRCVRHPRILRVIDVSSGRCVHAIRYDGRQWNECDDRWGDRGRNDRDRYDDRYDRRYDDRYDDEDRGDD